MNRTVMAAPFLLWACVLACTNGAALAQEKVFSRAQIEQDLSYLYQTLQATHYNLFAKVPKQAFDEAYAAVHGSIDGPMTYLQVHRLFQPFTALSGFAHCNAGYPFNQSYVPYVMGGGKVIPLDVAFDNDHVIVKADYSGDVRIAAGDRILAVNGVGIEAIMDGMYRYVSGDSRYMKRTSIEQLRFPRIHWMVFGEASSYELLLSRSQGTQFEVNVEAIGAMKFEERAASGKPLADTTRELRFISNVAYLRPGPFLNSTAPVDTSSHNTFQTGEFLRFLDGAFAEIRAKGAKGLVIDLRGNPGGDNSFSDPLIAYFAHRRFRFCSSFSVRTSRVTKAFWTGVEDPALEGLKREILSRDDGEIFTVELPYVEPRAEPERFTGRVYVLVDRLTYSNAVSVAAIVKDYGFAKIIGETTADSPTTYGAVHQFQLPNTAITVTYPKAFIVRPNGDPSFHGVVPDHQVSDDVFTDADEILQRTLEIVESEMSG